MYKVLITGGSGFIGTNLVDFYQTQGFDVINIDIEPPRNLAHFPVWKNIDITDEELLGDFVRSFDPDYCFHLAARTDLGGRTIDDYAANTVGVQNIIKALVGCNSLKLSVFASSMLVCKTGYAPKHEMDYCPSTPYGASKVEGERLVREMATGRIACVVVRPTSIWGPWFATPYKDFFIAVRRGIYAHPYGVRVRRSYGFVLNTIFQLDQLRIHQGGNLLGKVVYIADYEPIELHEWGTLIQVRMRARKIREFPMALFRLGACLGDVLKGFGIRFPLTSFRLSNMLTETIHDTTPLHDLTGPLPHKVEDGVRVTCDWLLSQDVLP
jgi:nucleoside-diphosphate-sugar epimerase